MGMILFMIVEWTGAHRSDEPTRGEPQYVWVFSTVLSNAIVVWKEEAVLSASYECRYFYIQFGK